MSGSAKAGPATATTGPAKPTLTRQTSENFLRHNANFRNKLLRKIPKLYRTNGFTYIILQKTTDNSIIIKPIFGFTEKSDIDTLLGDYAIPHISIHPGESSGDGTRIHFTSGNKGLSSGVMYFPIDLSQLCSNVITFEFGGDLVGIQDVIGVILEHQPTISDHLFRMINSVYEKKNTPEKLVTFINRSYIMMMIEVTNLLRSIYQPCINANKAAREAAAAARAAAMAMAGNSSTNSSTNSNANFNANSNSNSSTNSNANSKANHIAKKCPIQTRLEEKYKKKYSKKLDWEVGVDITQYIEKYRKKHGVDPPEEKNNEFLNTLSGGGYKSYVHVPNFGKRLVRYRKNGKAYVILKGKKKNLYK